MGGFYLESKYTVSTWASRWEACRWSWGPFAWRSCQKRDGGISSLASESAWILMRCDLSHASVVDIHADAHALAASPDMLIPFGILVLDIS